MEVSSKIVYFLKITPGISLKNAHWSPCNRGWKQGVVSIDRGRERPLEAICEGFQETGYKPLFLVKDLIFHLFSTGLYFLMFLHDPERHHRYLKLFFNPEVKQHQTVMFSFY